MSLPRVVLRMLGISIMLVCEALHAGDTFRTATPDDIREYYKSHELVRETRWHRVYMQDEHTEKVVSKFLLGEVDISLEQLKVQWDTWTHGERQEFAQAIGVAYSLVDDMEDILGFLMQHGSYWVAMTIALPVATILPNEESVPFLMAAVSAAGPDNSINFYQALASTGSPEATPTILNALEYFIDSIANSNDDQKAKDAVWKAKMCVGYLRELYEGTQGQPENAD